MLTERCNKAAPKAKKPDLSQRKNRLKARADAMQALLEMIIQLEDHISCMSEFVLPHSPLTKSLIDRRVAQVVSYRRILKQREEGDWRE